MLDILRQIPFWIAGVSFVIGALYVVVLIINFAMRGKTPRPNDMGDVAKLFGSGILFLIIGVLLTLDLGEAIPILGWSLGATIFGAATFGVIDYSIDNESRFGLVLLVLVGLGITVFCGYQAIVAIIAAV